MDTDTICPVKMVPHETKEFICKVAFFPRESPIAEDYGKYPSKTRQAIVEQGSVVVLARANNQKHS